MASFEIHPPEMFSETVLYVVRFNGPAAFVRGQQYSDSVGPADNQLSRPEAVSYVIKLIGLFIAKRVLIMRVFNY